MRRGLAGLKFEPAPDTDHQRALGLFKSCAFICAQVGLHPVMQRSHPQGNSSFFKQLKKLPPPWIIQHIRFKKNPGRPKIYLYQHPLTAPLKAADGYEAGRYICGTPWIKFLLLFLRRARTGLI